jgi:type I restriction enzyme M protein
VVRTRPPRGAGLATEVSIEKIRAGGYRLNPQADVTSTGKAPDSRTRARQVGELTRRLHQLAEQAARIDRTVDAYLDELSW